MFHCGCGKSSDGSVADAARRKIYDPAQGLVVVGVKNQPEISYGVAHFLALIERQASIDAIRNRTAPEHFFENAALGVGSVENGIFIEAVVGGMAAARDGLSHEGGFVVVAVSARHSDFFTFYFAAESADNAFRDLPDILRNKRIGGFDDGRCRAVVCFELESLQSGILFFEREDIRYVGATERIDALGVVADDSQPIAPFGQAAYYAVLGKIGVLILVDKDISEPSAKSVADFGLIAHQNIHVVEQVVEIHCRRGAAPFAVELIDPGCHRPSRFFVA